MTYSKILLLALFIFSPQVFAGGTCVDLSGTYSCSVSDGTTFDMTVTTDASLLTVSSLGNTHTYVADRENHGSYTAMCNDGLFSVIAPTTDSNFLLTTYVMNDSQELDISRDIVTIEGDENNATMNFVGNLDHTLCTRN